MGVLSWLGLAESSALNEAQARAQAAEDLLGLVRESAWTTAELALEDRGWATFLLQGEMEFTRTGLGRIASILRFMAVKHPLIKRGLGIRQAYVWGQGVQVQARATGSDGEQDVNAVVQAVMDDPGNRAALFGDQAQEENERALGTDGNVFLVCFTSPLTGFVQVRTLPFDQVQDVISNPEDAAEPWYYQRVWVETAVDQQTGTSTTVSRTAYYPAIGYRPAPRARYTTIGGHPVIWDAPVYHVSVNRLQGWKFGIGDAYAAMDDARLYREFLTDWAVLVKALSQFAFRASPKGSKAQKMRQALTRRPVASAPDANPGTVGATALLPEDATLEAIPKTGATIDSESGRPLAAMIAAALDVPVTALLADPGQSGARAVAETLETPTRLAMEQRQSVWKEAVQAILAYVIRAAVRAPRGPLQGTITRDPFTGREAVALAGDTDATIEVVFPSLVEDVPVKEIVEAIVKADSAEILPPLLIAKLLLRAFDVDDADEILEDLTDENGQWIDPRAGAGQAAVDAFNRGQDPAALVGAGGTEGPESGE